MMMEEDMSGATFTVTHKGKERKGNQRKGNERKGREH
jgi:hypothetical protein